MRRWVRGQSFFLESFQGKSIPSGESVLLGILIGISSRGWMKGGGKGILWKVNTLWTSSDC